MYIWEKECMPPPQSPPVTFALTQREGRDGGGEGTEGISRPGEESRP